MGDAIDERNKREKIARSIIKFWNVNYTLPPEKDESDKIGFRRRQRRMRPRNGRRLMHLSNGNNGRKRRKR